MPIIMFNGNEETKGLKIIIISKVCNFLRVLRVWYDKLKFRYHVFINLIILANKTLNARRT